MKIARVCDENSIQILAFIMVYKPRQFEVNFLVDNFMKIHFNLIIRKLKFIGSLKKNKINSNDILLTVNSKKTKILLNTILMT